MLHLCSVLLLLLLAALSSAEVINFQVCPGSEETCSIAEVRVNPCPQASSKSACHIRRRRPVTMSFDFTPKFDAERLEASLGWVKSETEELPLITMDHEGCKYVSCPIKANEKQTYTIDIPIEPKFPLSFYTIRWALKDPVSGKRCCFTHDIKVVR